jgi:hypothetical protein
MEQRSRVDCTSSLSSRGGIFTFFFSMGTGDRLRPVTEIFLRIGNASAPFFLRR